MHTYLLVIVLALSASGTHVRDLQEDAEKYLLPGNIIPSHYSVDITTYIEKFDSNDEESFKFKGSVWINVQVVNDTDELVIHSYDNIEITSATVLGLESGVLHDVVDTGYDSVTSKQTFRVSPSLARNTSFIIYLAYSGYNNDDLFGFYRSSYVDSNGVTRWLLTTQFEDFGARQAFPCFDEPKYKATFDLTLQFNKTLVDLGYRAFSNADVDFEDTLWLLTTDLEEFGARQFFPCFDEPKYKATFQMTAKFNKSLIDLGYRAFFNSEVDFEDTMGENHVTFFERTALPMSTYLVAFIIAPFSASPEPAFFNSSYNGENGEKPFYTIGQPKYFSPVRQDEISQISGVATLNLMTKLTKVGYGFEKMEQAGIPDFAAGAMENWGLVTYREGYVFWNNNTGTTSQKQGVATVVAHELAHQWFGDLVTLHWWSDLWLNEGFANFYEFHAADQFREPGLDTTDWDLIGQFVTDNMQGGAFIVDGRDGTRPLTFETYDPDVIDRLGDTIAYNKGGSVIRMWMHSLGTDLFYAGLNRYLTSQKEGLGRPEILLSSWDEVVNELPAADRPVFDGLSVSEVFRGWHIQAGYPVVLVENNAGSLRLSQKRFLSSGGNTSTRWNIPITYSTNLELNFDKTSPISILKEGDSSLSVELKNSSADWVVVNNQQTGYYRVNYDENNWDKLLAVLNDPDQYQQIHEYNRAQILDDADALGASTYEEYLPANTVLRLLPMIKHDRSLTVWRTAIRVMNGMLQRINMAHPAQYNRSSFILKNFFWSLTEPAYTELTLSVSESDSHVRKLLREAIAEFACSVGLPACQHQAGQLYKKGVFHPDMRKVVLCEGVKQGGEAEWTRSYEVAVGEESPVQMDHIHALTCTNDQVLLDRLWRELASNLVIKRDGDVLMFLEALLKKHPVANAIKVLTIITERRWRLKSKSKKFNDLKHEASVLLNANDLAFASSYSAPTSDVKAEVTYHQAWMKKKLPQILYWLSAIH